MSKIVRMISIYNYGSRGGNSIKYIVLHYTGNKGDTAKNIMQLGQLVTVKENTI